MEAAILIDMLFGVLSIVIAVLLRRTFQMFDRLQDEDKVLHSRITELSTHAVTRIELNGAVDRVINRLDKLEERLINGR